MNNKQIDNLIEIEDSSLTIKDINEIVKDKNIFDFFKRKYQDQFYSTILRTITHKNFDENHAEQLYKEIIIHLNKLNNKLHRDIGIVVASTDYLSNIKNIMNEPKIIEEDKSNSIVETSTKDGLTSLYLRNIFDIYLNKSIENAKRQNTNLSLLMIDIDDFKNVNDTFGHQKGDEVLSKIGYIINESVRETDFACRYGGEELTVIMPNTSSSNAFIIAERIRETIEKENFTEFFVTVSIGISEIDKNINTSIQIIKYADNALYEAKHTGKNKVCIAQI